MIEGSRFSALFWDGFAVISLKTTALRFLFIADGWQFLAFLVQFHGSLVT